jgi:hypothetical protein|tara:strand:- start:22 stop:531 length:510 start_codon:yes stop_codon:yes gene_type:complete
MVLAELSIAISAVKGLGELIDSAKSIAEVAGKLDEALALSDRAKKSAPTKAKGKTERQIEQQLEKFDNTSGESTDLGAIVQEYTDAASLKHELYRIGTKLDVKFGSGTWDKILEIRKKRLAKQEKSEQDHRERLKELQEERKRFWLELLKVLGLLITLTFFSYWIMQYY